MAYCTPADIENRIDPDELIRLTDETGSGTADTAKVQAAIIEAQAEVDSYCARLHAVPFPDPVPEMIAKITRDIAVYNLYGLKHAAPEDCETRYKRAVDFLDKVSRGRVDLGATAPAPLDDGGPEVIKPAEDRTFTLDRMGGF